MAEREVYRRLRIVIDEDEGAPVPDEALDAHIVATLESTGMKIGPNYSVVDTVEVEADDG